MHGMFRAVSEVVYMRKVIRVRDEKHPPFGFIGFPAMGHANALYRTHHPAEDFPFRFGTFVWEHGSGKAAPLVCLV